MAEHACVRGASYHLKLPSFMPMAEFLARSAKELVDSTRALAAAPTPARHLHQRAVLLTGTAASSPSTT